MGLLDAGSSRPWPEVSEGLASDRGFTHDHRLTRPTHSPATTQTLLSVYSILLGGVEAVHDLGREENAVLDTDSSYDASKSYNPVCSGNMTKYSSVDFQIGLCDVTKGTGAAPYPTKRSISSQDGLNAGLRPLFSRELQDYLINDAMSKSDG